AILLLKEAVAYCESAQDYISRDIFNHILKSEEEHIDWLETQLEIIQSIGLPNYLQSQL
ncbi:MAG: ferritin-like domain-containing protein, partial [Methylosarcina sp.]